MIKIKYSGESVVFKEMLIVKARYCVLCNNLIEEGDPIFLVKNNHLLFPDTIIHKKCFRPPSDSYSSDFFTWTAYTLHKLWKEAQKYRYWFE